MKLSKLYNAILLSAVVLMTSGCCGTICEPDIRYVDRIVEVKVPVKHEIVKPAKPIVGNTLSETLVNIKEYNMKLGAKVDSANGTTSK